MFPNHNTYFKPPKAQLLYPQRSPSPPHSYIEPLSPSSIRPRPVEPSFYYPAVSNGYRPPQAAEAAGRNDNGNSKKRGHHRVSSSIDTLADAALSIDAGYSTVFPKHYVQYGQQDTQTPHKRARSEAWPAVMSVNVQARPLTSYNAWSQQPQPTPYETRVEDAALLLNFSTTGGKSVSHTPQQSYRPHANSMPSQPRYPPQQLPAPMYEQSRYHIASPAMPLPQYTSERKGLTPETSSDRSREETMSQVHNCHHNDKNKMPTHQTHTPPEELDQFPHALALNHAQAVAVPPKKRGWPKGKPRGPNLKKENSTEKPTAAAVARRQTARRKRANAKLMKGSKREALRQRRSSFSDAISQLARSMLPSRSVSVPPAVHMVILPPSKTRRQPRAKHVTMCNGCQNQRTSTIGELDDWIFCDGCKRWYHFDCAGFRKAAETQDVGKFFCQTCEPKHGKTTYVRKSTRAHTSVDYAELQKGQLKTSAESNEHHYIQPIKDGTFTFDPETFPRIRPELLTRDHLERSDLFTEPIVIPAKWNSRPWAQKNEHIDTAQSDQAAVPDPLDDDTHEYDCVLDEGQDKLDMVMPKALTVRKVCNLVGMDTPLDVIDVKTQNSGAKWNLARWADYYESNAEDKPIRNVISLEVSQTKLGRLLRRPKVVRDIDLQDRVWPAEETEKGKWPKVQYYCLMSIADSYTDFHIDFGGSSVYYHLIKGKKTFFFIPPKPKHLKAYEEWNENPQQNFTFLPNITKECYRVDLSEGDTMLIPSGWIHAVWTPETSLVIGGNFLTHMNFKNQFRVAEIEKNNETPLKFRYPFFQRLMWHTAMHYMRTDPMPEEVSAMFLAGKRYERTHPIWQDFDQTGEDDQPGSFNARYYSQAELDGLPELSNFIFRTVMMAMGRAEGITVDRMKRVNASIPKGYGEPLDIAKAFALWVAWKRGNEDPPAWTHPDAILPNSKEQTTPKKLSARAIKELEKLAAIKEVPPERQSQRVQKRAEMVVSAPISTEAPDATDATFNLETSANEALATSSPPPSPHMFDSPATHQEGIFAPSHDLSASPPSTAPTAMMLSVFQGQHISTPKTSVLGPKRVACDACRRRRIRCKHKDFVVQAGPDMTMQQLNGSVESFGASADGEMPSQTLYDDYDGAHTHESTVNGLNGAEIKLENGVRLGAVPGTNAYVDANIPMTLNGVSLFGDAKRGRSKACLECRKSKRRCIHDDQGNVDPVKAAEQPIPRVNPAMKKRQSEEGLNNDDKRVKLASAANAQQGVAGVLKPAKYNKKSAVQAEWPSAPATTMGESSPNIHTGLPIDPSLTSTYPEPNQDLYQNGHYPYAPVRPHMVSLPSLEEIATEVLDMDGGAGADLDDLAAIQQYNEQTAAPQLDAASSLAAIDSAAKDQEPAAPAAAQEDTAAAAQRARENSIASIPMYRPPSKSPEMTRASLNETKKEVTSPAKPKNDSRIAPSSRVKHERMASREGVQLGEGITA